MEVSYKDELKKVLIVVPLLIPIYLVSYLSFLNESFLLSYLLFYFGIFIYCVSSWRIGILSFFVWFPLVGAIRKWGMPIAHKALYFSPNFIIFSCFIAFLFSGGLKLIKNVRPQSVMTIYACIIAYSFFSFFVSLNVHPLLGIVGFILHFSFFPLVMMIPALFTQREQINRLVILMLVVTTIPFIVGVIQYQKPLDSKWNLTYTSDSVSFSDDRTPRIASTFTYTGGYGTYLSAIFGLILYGLFNSRSSLKSLIPTLILTVLCVCNVLFTNLRGSLFGCGFVLAVTTIFLLFTEHRFKVFIIIALSILTFLFLRKYVIPEESDPILTNLKRVQSDSTRPRIIWMLTPTLTAEHGMFGRGIGSSCQGVKSIVKEDFIVRDTGIGIEKELDRISIEMGYLGLFAYAILNFTILMSLFFILMKNYSIDTKILACVTIGYTLGNGMFFSYIHNYVVNTYFHALLGITSFFILKDEEAKTNAQNGLTVEPAGRPDSYSSV